MKRPAVLILLAALAAALQIGFLAWTISGRAAVLRDGREVLLKVEPIDPRDLLRGDYVRLGYDISQLSPSQFSGGGDKVEPDEFAPVWVLLRKGADGVFTAIAAARARDQISGAADGDVVIRGEARGLRSTGSGSATFGIERFYLPEGDGKQIEKDMRERPFFVVVAVADDGTAQIKAFRDGETVLYEEPYY